MIQESTRERTKHSGGARSLASYPPWHRLALAAIVVLSAFLNLFWITQEGWGNPYYAAGVKSMFASWTNFFFISFDAGFVSVDKPPLGLWIQAASAWLLGFEGWALLLPQAIAGVLSVALLYHLVSRAFRPVAGLVAALVLAVTPVVVATSRNNTADMLVVLTVLVAAWAVIRATEAGRLRWLLFCAAIVGLGFNIKMLQAFLVLPAFYLLYLLAARTTRWRRVVHLGTATLVLVAVSLSWAVAVDLTPEDQRPFVGSSNSNSALELALGYNGIERLLGVAGGRRRTPAGRFHTRRGRRRVQRERLAQSSAAPEPAARRTGRLAGAAGGGGPGGGRLAEASPPAARHPAAGPRVVGDVVLYGGRLLQRRRTLPSLLPGDARPSDRSPGGHRRGGAVEELPQAWLAWMAIAARAGRHGRRAGLYPVGLRGLAVVAGACDLGLVSGRGCHTRGRAPEEE